MTSVLHNLLICTVSGSIMFGFGSLLNLKFKKKSMSGWYYGVIIMSLIMFILPLQLVFSIPKLISISVPSDMTVLNISGAAETLNSSGGMKSISLVNIVFGIWLSVAMTLGIRNIVLYIKAASMLRRISVPCRSHTVYAELNNMLQKLRIRRKVRVFVSENISSPLLFGIMRPTIVIPDFDFSEDELKMIFAHELTHLKHFDLHIKLLGIFVGCIHWFNPFVYILRRSLGTVSEWCCDESVLKRLNLKDAKDYGRLIISVIESNTKGIAAYSASMASAKSHIKRRLLKIAGFREITKTLKAVSVFLAAGISVCSLTAFGFTQAAAVMPDEIAEVFTEPNFVSQRFSADRKYEDNDTSKFNAYSERSETEQENDNYSSDDFYDTNSEPVYESVEQVNTDGAYDYISEVDSGITDYPAVPGYTFETNTDTSAYSAEVNVTDVSGGESNIPESGTVPSPESNGLFEDDSAETVQIPSKSAYVFNLVFDGGNTIMTPVLEAIETTTVSVSFMNSLRGIEIFECGPGGENTQSIYRCDDEMYSCELPLIKGRYYIFALTGDKDGKNTVIIQ